MLTGPSTTEHTEGVGANEHMEDRPTDVMTELLHWAVQHSDPARLAEITRNYQNHNLTIRDVYGQDFIDALFSHEASSMKHLVARIGDFRNSSVQDEELEDAVMRLQELVEQVDNAANLDGLGGLMHLLDLAVSTRGPHLRKLALWTLGVAVQNNAPVQISLLGIDGLRRLAAQLPSCHGGSTKSLQPAEGNGSAGWQEEEGEESEICGKLLFAISGLMRNNVSAQASALELGVFDWLFQVGIRHPSVAVVKKSLATLDTVLAQNPDGAFLSASLPREDVLAQALLGCVRGADARELDLDLVEKALLLLNRLLSLRPLLFASGFGSEFVSAVHGMMQRCEHAFSGVHEFCNGLVSLANQAQSMLVAHSVTDEDL